MQEFKEKDTGRPIEIGICSSFTDEPIKEGIQYWINNFKQTANIRFASYNQVFQELYNPTGVLSSIKNGINIVLIRFEDLIQDNESSTKEQIKILKSQLGELADIIQNINGNKRIVGVLPISDHIKKSEIGEYLEKINNEWFRILENTKHIDVIDMRGLHNNYTIKTVYNQYANRLAHIPYSEEYYWAMGSIIARKIISYYSLPFKVIVLDCDNTLWNGVCGEIGTSNVVIDTERTKLQKFLIGCYNKGMLLAICSKNNEKDVMDVFMNHPDMQLRKEHIVAMKINWNHKCENILEIAKELKLGLESFIFLDDSPVECSEMMMKCPQVLTIKLPMDSSFIMDYILNIWAFDMNHRSKEDEFRTKYYQNERMRNETRTQYTGLEDFIKSLQVRVYVSLAEEEDAPRISQLTQRTNQFNLTTKRMTQEDIIDNIQNEVVDCYVIEVEDKFGSYGLVGMMMIRDKKEELFLDMFLLSCRVLGRGVENQILSFLKALCLKKNKNRIIAPFYQTDRNLLVREFLINSKGTLQQKEDTLELFSIKKEDIIEEDLVFTNRPMVNSKKQVTQRKDNGVCQYLDHVGIAVKKMEEQMKYYEKLGYKVHTPIYDPLQDVHLVMCRKEGYIPIELVAAASIQSPVNQFLEENSHIFYHICIEVKDFITLSKELDRKQIKYDLIREPKEAILFQNKKVGFILIQSVGIVEFIENDTKKIKETNQKDSLQVYTSDLDKAEIFFEILGYTRIINNEKSLYRNLSNQSLADIQLIQKSYKTSGYHLCTYDESTNEPMSGKKENSIGAEKILVINEENLKHKCYYKPLQYWNGEILQELCNAQGELEEKIIKLCRLIFDKEDIKRTDNFYKIGGNSLKLIKLMSKIYEVYKIEIPLNRVFKNPTINEILSYIKE